MQRLVIAIAFGGMTAVVLVWLSFGGVGLHGRQTGGDLDADLGVNVALMPPLYDQDRELRALAERFVTALNSQSDDAVMDLVTGYQGAAERIRDAALNDEAFLSRTDLRAYDKLMVFALRDRFSRRRIRNLSDKEVIQIRPKRGESIFTIPLGQKIFLRQITWVSVSQAQLDLYFGAQAQSFPVIKTGGEWRVDFKQVFDPGVLTPTDIEILDQVLDDTENQDQDQAWAQLYSDLSGSAVRDELLKLP